MDRDDQAKRRPALVGMNRHRVVAPWSPQLGPAGDRCPLAASPHGNLRCQQNRTFALEGQHGLTVAVPQRVEQAPTHGRGELESFVLAEADLQGRPATHRQ